MAQRTTPTNEGRTTMQLVLGGVIVALLVLLVATVVRTPLHPPYYDTISATSGQTEAP